MLDKTEQLHKLLADVESAYTMAAEAGGNAAGIAALARQRMILLKEIFELEDAMRDTEAERMASEMNDDELVASVGAMLVDLPAPLLDRILVQLATGGRMDALRRALGGLHVVSSS